VGQRIGKVIGRRIGRHIGRHIGITLQRFEIMVLFTVAAPAAVLACGACVEDNMAATYDHAVVEAAAKHNRMVVFCSLQGPSVASDRVRRAAAAVPGIDPASIRVSVAPAALSFALDPRVQSPSAAAAEIRRRVGAGVNVVVLKGLAPAVR